jgi:Domain of unknown function (DUF1707)
MQPQPEDTPDRRPALRASDAERDVVVQHLQAAFAEGRLDDQEFDQRMRTALAARTHGDLEPLMTDLPGTTAAAGPRLLPATSQPKAGRNVVAFKNHVQHGGRWRVPERLRAVIYKGGCRLDLRAAELTSPVTTVVAVAYKSNIEIIVPPGVRVEMGGFGISRPSSDDDWEAVLPADAPVVYVKAVAYKGVVETRTGPPKPR